MNIVFDEGNFSHMNNVSQPIESYDPWMREEFISETNVLQKHEDKIVSSNEDRILEFERWAPNSGEGDAHGVRHFQDIYSRPWRMRMLSNY